MELRTTVLGLLKKARDLVCTGQNAGIIEAISSLRAEASGPMRDLAYYALLDTAALGEKDASIAVLSRLDHRETTVELLDATIRRISSKLH
jgi:hypothetical protein